MASMGVFGKLPAHGDFVQRNLPGSFVEPWDEWLQRAVHGSREVVGERWLDYYLTSPIWRFAFSAGVLDARSWAGILVPSVDSVGRYFPVTLAVPGPAGSNPFSCMRDESSWYQALSDLAIEALQSPLQVDQVIEQFPAMSGGGRPVSCAAESTGIFFLEGGGAPQDAYPQLLKRLIEESVDSFSLWWCAGTEYRESSTMLCHGLPDALTYRTMLGAPELHW